MTRTHDLDHCRKWGRPSLATGIKCGFVALSGLMVTIASAAPADADDVTLTLQKMDISVQPVDQPFSVTVSIHKDQDNKVTVDIPSIKRNFGSSEDSPRFVQVKPFPILWQPTPADEQRSSNSYPPLPANYPLGGYIDTIADNIPVEFRPTSGLPITFPVGSSVTPGLIYTGYIDNQGRLQFSAPGNYPVGVGPFATLPAHVTYTIGKVPDVTISNFQISLGFSDAAKWNPNDFTE